MIPPQPIPPGPGQESVWDYPRPPRLEREPARLRVVHAGTAIADTTSAWRLLETSHPPTYYLPPEDVVDGAVVPVTGQSWCEWKGRASYLDVIAGGKRAARAAWRYLDPTPPFMVIRAHLAFHPTLVDECWVGDERATPQPGGFYGGWVTSRIVGPIKGGPGSMGW